MKKNKFKISLGIKIFFIVSSLLFFIIWVAFFSYSKIKEVSKELFNLSEYIIPVTNQISLVETHTLEQEKHYERLIKLYEMDETSKKHKDKEFKGFNERGVKVDKEIEKAIRIVKEAESKSAVPEDKEYFKNLEPFLVKIEKEHQDFHDHVLKVLTFLKKNRKADAYALEEKIKYEEDHLDKDINAIYLSLRNYTKKTGDIVDAHQKDILVLNLVLTASAVFLGLLTAFIFTRGLTRPVRILNSAMQGVKNGNYNTFPDVKTNDEIGMLAATFQTMMEQLALKDKIKSTFGKYVDPRVVENLINQKNITTGGEKKIMTVMFSHVNQVDTAIEKLSADEQVNVINKYFSIMSKAVDDSRGVIDKFIGTMIMAFWGTPFTSENNHPIHACKAHLKQKELVREGFKNFQKNNPNIEKDFFSLRCGISTGSLIVGNMGSNQSKSYTVIGETVNIASRLHGAAEQYGVPALINEMANSAVIDKIVTREIDTIRVIGLEEGLTVFDILFEKGVNSNENNTLLKLKKYYEEGLKYYRYKDWDNAVKLFKSCLKIKPSDKPSKIILNRITTFRKNPPKENWDGVWNLKKK
ncbi:MAG: HAMP domain-containing protein [Deltaproteobacteria bacterium]|nr:HAMP domain-containing protein [Deltaproteobacteria bacterium]